MHYPLSRRHHTERIHKLYHQIRDNNNNKQRRRKNLSTQERHHVFSQLIMFSTQFSMSRPSVDLPTAFQVTRLWDRMAIDGFGNVVVRSAHPSFQSPLRWHVDHIVPFVRGGECSPSNFVGLQEEVNRQKGTSLLPECLHAPLRDSYWHRLTGYYTDCCYHLSLNKTQAQCLRHACQTFPPTTWTFGLSTPMMIGLIYFVDNFVRPFSYFEQQLFYQCFVSFCILGLHRSTTTTTTTTRRPPPWQSWMWYFTLQYVPEENSIEECHVCVHGNAMGRPPDKTCYPCSWLRMHIDLLYQMVSNGSAFQPTEALWSLRIFRVLYSWYQQIQNTPSPHHQIPSFQRPSVRILVHSDSDKYEWRTVTTGRLTALYCSPRLPAYWASIYAVAYVRPHILKQQQRQEGTIKQDPTKTRNRWMKKWWLLYSCVLWAIRCSWFLCICYYTHTLLRSRVSFTSVVIVVTIVVGIVFVASFFRNGLLRRRSHA